jgi:hypothetical protein
LAAARAEASPPAPRRPRKPSVAAAAASALGQRRLLVNPRPAVHACPQPRRPAEAANEYLPPCEDARRATRPQASASLGFDRAVPVVRGHDAHASAAHRVALEFKRHRHAARVNASAVRAAWQPTEHALPGAPTAAAILPARSRGVRAGGGRPWSAAAAVSVSEPRVSVMPVMLRARESRAGRRGQAFAAAVGNSSGTPLCPSRPNVHLGRLALTTIH